VRDPRRTALVEVAIQSSGDTKFGLLLSVVVLTKWTIDFFADLSFDDASRSAPAAETAEPTDGVKGFGVVEQPARMWIKKTNVERNARWIFIFFIPPHAGLFPVESTHRCNEPRLGSEEGHFLSSPPRTA